MLVLAALFSFSDILIFGIIAAALAGASLYAWPWARQRGRFLIGAGGTLAGWIAWNLVPCADQTDVAITATLTNAAVTARRRLGCGARTGVGSAASVQRLSRRRVG